MRCLLLLAVIALSGCAFGANYGADAEANKTQSRVLAYPAQEVYEAALQLAVEMNWGVSMNNDDLFLFQAETPLVMTRWADEVSIVVREEEGASNIRVRSWLGQSPNRNYISEYLDALEAKLLEEGE